MNRRFYFPIVPLALALLLPATASLAAENLFDRFKGLIEGVKKPSSLSLSNKEIGKGLQEALRVGTERVVGRLGAKDGFNADAKIHIPLPDKLKTVQSTLRKIGLSKMADDLELRLNRAAEAATPKAKKLFWDAISGMTMDDVQRIYKGPSDAATRYFQGKMTGPLKTSMRPVIDSALAKVGAIRSYDRMIGKYRDLPFVPDVKADLSNHVLDKALGGLFLYLADEEAAIRKNPAKQTTRLLKKLFGKGN